MANRECGRQRPLRLTRNTELEQVRQEEKNPKFHEHVDFKLEVEMVKIIGAKDHCIQSKTSDFGPTSSTPNSEY